jgi:hypothetical protein
MPANSVIDVESFNRFFVEKVAEVQSSTSDSPPSVFHRARSDVAFRAFSPLVTDDVINAVRKKTGQIFGSRFNTDVNLRTGYRCDGAVFLWRSSIDRWLPAISLPVSKRRPSPRL